MKYIRYNCDGSEMVSPVCESCLEGEHVSYGDDHRLGEKDRRDCKSVEDNVQCICTPDFPELFDAIGNRERKVYDTRQDAENEVEEGK